MTDYISNINTYPLSSNAFYGQFDFSTAAAVFTDVKFTASQWKTYSLSSIIPNDGFDYEVQFQCYCTTGTTSGNAVQLQLHSGTTTSGGVKISTRCVRCQTRTSNTQIQAGQAILPIKGSDLNITIQHTDTTTSGNCSLYVVSIRRIGANQLSSDTNYISNINTSSGAVDIGGDLLDGQWVASSFLAADNISISAGTATALDLSNCIPDDNYSYEILVWCSGRTGTTSGNTVSLRVGTSSTANQNPAIARQVTRTASYMLAGGSSKVIVGTNRTIYVVNTGSATATNVRVYVRAYRRIGTNSSTKETSICIPSSSLIPNAIIYGNPTISNGVVSDFSSENYLDVTKGRQNNNAEFVIKFTMGNTQSSSPQTIWHAQYLTTVELAANTWDIKTYNWGTSSQVALFTSTANTTYWVKTVINGQTKTYSYSTDGENYTQVASFTDTGVDLTDTHPLRIGNCSLNRLLERVFIGSIDLNETYINVDGKRFWNGMDYIQNLPVGGYISDSQWVMSAKTVYSGTQFTNGTHNYTITNYLPEDDVPYEVLVSGTSNTGATSGNIMELSLETTTDVIASELLGYAITRTNSSVADDRAITAIITQRNGEFTFSVWQRASAKTGNCGATLHAYKRLGTNE